MFWSDLFRIKGIGYLEGQIGFGLGPGFIGRFSEPAADTDQSIGINATAAFGDFFVPDGINAIMLTFNAVSRILVWYSSLIIVVHRSSY